MLTLMMHLKIFLGDSEWLINSTSKVTEISDLNKITQVTSGDFYWPLNRNKKDSVGR